MVQEALDATPGGRIRVARIITRLNIGGPAQQAVILSTGLPADRYETVLVTGQAGAQEGDLLELRGEQGVRPLELPSLGREISPLRDVVSFVRLVRILRRFRPHIVHTHMSKAGLLGRLAARVAGVPVVIHTFHGNIFGGYFGAARTGLFLFLERAMARLSTRIVAISHRQAEEIRALGIAAGERLVEIPLGLQLSPFLDPPRGRLRAELRIGPDVPLVGMVARLVPIKRVDLFVEAAAILARSRPEARYVIAGDGELRADIERQIAERGLASRVRLLGWRGDLPAIHGDLDVVVQTSANEGTPVSLIEALAAGRPVVATDVGGVADVVTPECGILVPFGDPAAVAQAVARLLTDPVLARTLGAAGRARVFPAYDAGTLTARIDALYSALTARRGVR